MLKKIRVAFSLVVMSGVTFCFLDFAGLLSDNVSVLTHIQLIPAIISLNLFVVSAIILISLLFGRIYCSSVCPMGTFQDFAGWVSRKISKNRIYTYTNPKNILRGTILAACILIFFIISPILLGFIDPYSAYGRIAVHIFRPLYMLANNSLESIFRAFNNYTFYRVEVFVAGFFSFVTGLLTFLIISFLAWHYGRFYCNTICPAGTILGLISKFSLFKININSQKCTHCGACAGKCKASCINSENMTIDHSRCVNCFNCVTKICKKNAISYKLSLKQVQLKTKNQNDECNINRQRRIFLFTTALAILTNSKIWAQQMLQNSKSYKIARAIAPPGAKSFEHLKERCTSCHLCISKCPTNVLKPAFAEYGISGIMQPVMSFEKGFCNYDCTICTTVCPNEALIQLTVDEKHLTQVGKVTFIESNCIVHNEGTNCGACAEHCPTQAVSMIPYKGGLTIPSINQAICVGCGACEFICPVRPYRAIYIEPNVTHQVALPFEKEKKEEVMFQDFGF